MKTILEYLQKKHIDVQEVDYNQLIVEELAKMLKGKIKPNDIQYYTTEISEIRVYQNLIPKEEADNLKDKITKNNSVIDVKIKDSKVKNFMYYNFYNENHKIILDIFLNSSILWSIKIENNLADELKKLL